MVNALSSVHPFTKNPRLSVSALGEARLIAAIRRWLGSASPRAPFGIGDDCAVVPAGRSAQLITVDPVIYGEHIDDAVPPRAGGEKLFKRNLSDIAAMGGRPRAAVVALAIDAHVKLAWLEQFYRGLAAVSRRYRVPIVGGDIAHHKGGIVATLTLVGEAPAHGRVVTRTGARTGDWIFVTGSLGNSLRSGHHWKFAPRLAEGQWLARQPAVRAMIDLSDGLAKDIGALTPAGAVPALNDALLPLRHGADLRGALTDGEDYELAFALAARTDPGIFARAWQKKFPATRLSCVGRFVHPNALPVDALNLADYRGFEHLNTEAVK
jgi:thiamine-monophosphate kinase